MGKKSPTEIDQEYANAATRVGHRDLMQQELEDEIERLKVENVKDLAVMKTLRKEAQSYTQEEREAHMEAQKAKA